MNSILSVKNTTDDGQYILTKVDKPKSFAAFVDKVVRDIPSPVTTTGTLCQKNCEDPIMILRSRGLLDAGIECSQSVGCPEEMEVAFYIEKRRRGKLVKQFVSDHHFKDGKLVYASTEQVAPELTAVTEKTHERSETRSLLRVTDKAQLEYKHTSAEKDSTSRTSAGEFKQKVIKEHETERRGSRIIKSASPSRAMLRKDYMNESKTEFYDSFTRHSRHTPTCHSSKLTIANLEECVTKVKEVKPAKVSDPDLILYKAKLRFKTPKKSSKQPVCYKSSSEFFHVEDIVAKYRSPRKCVNRTSSEKSKYSKISSRSTSEMSHGKMSLESQRVHRIPPKTAEPIRSIWDRQIQPSSPKVLRPPKREKRPHTAGGYVRKEPLTGMKPWERKRTVLLSDWKDTSADGDRRIKRHTISSGRMDGLEYKTPIPKFQRRTLDTIYHREKEGLEANKQHLQKRKENYHPEDSDSSTRTLPFAVPRKSSERGQGDLRGHASTDSSKTSVCTMFQSSEDSSADGKSSAQSSSDKDTYEYEIQLQQRGREHEDEIPQQRRELRKKSKAEKDHYETNRNGRSEFERQPPTTVRDFKARRQIYPTKLVHFKDTGERLSQHYSGGKTALDSKKFFEDHPMMQLGYSANNPQSPARQRYSKDYNGKRIAIGNQHLKDHENISYNHEAVEKIRSIVNDEALERYRKKYSLRNGNNSIAKNFGSEGWDSPSSGSVASLTSVNQDHLKGVFNRE